ncbi:PTS glucose transporter subunit IIA [Marinilactibacillus sp. XAAS-LB27]|uniref:PTS sugar transporter subunit IIA n=1 Tax=Marinilactibacillus sp. XAAS-LB27 TaxID=3114538 RepID=UPI002E199B30|nr:PTS glucose transporter subunit IIA [Marinilactibacillus sp. XAAS-LB27]
MNLKGINMKIFEKKIIIYNPVKGTVKNLSEVNDEMFSKKLMGNGFAVEPNSNNLYSPVKGKVTSVFPTKHAISIKAKGNQDVLIHIGIDTVELNGDGFEMIAAEGDTVDFNTKLVSVDFDYIKSSGKETDVIVVFPEAKDKELSIEYGTTNQNEEIGLLK